MLYGLLFLALLAISGASAFAQSGGAVLYNGIVLPQVWPPIAGPTQTYQIPSYITNPPSVIPIDVGRQLFVDDFLIQQTTMTRTQHQPVLYPLDPIISPGIEDTAGFAMPFSDGAWFDPSDQLFKMWLYCGPGNTTCYAYSSDGKNWTRPSIPDAAVPNTDQVLVAAQGQPGITGLIVWMDLQDPNPARKFKAFASDSTFPAYLFFSPDGIHWTPTNRSQYPIPLNDRTTYFWNPFRSVWVDSLKTFSTLPTTASRPSYPSRVRLYTESTNLSNWTPATPVDSSNFWVGPDVNDPPYIPGGSYPQLYNLDAVAYESVMVGMFSWFYPGPGDTDPGNLPGPDLVELGAGFSRDGFQWFRPTRGSGPGTNGAFIAASDVPGTWNTGNVQSAGGCFLVVGDELWFYFSSQSALHNDSSAMGFTGLATLRRDGFYSMDAGSSAAVLTTRPVRFSGKYLFVNVKDPQGSLQVQILNPSNGSVLATSFPVSVDKTLQAVTWQNGLADLSSFANQSVEFQFTLTNGELYSFWVSASTSGASNGYVAANGPGFTGSIDNLGIGAYPTIVATPEIYQPGGIVSPSTNITILTRTLGATIYYTTDGSTPTTNSPVYTGPIHLAASGTVNAIASAPGLSNSPVAAATFTVDNTPPTVSITSPTSGQIVSAGIVISASAGDNSAIASVQFAVDGVPIGTDTSAPYTVSLETTTLTNGSHQVTATAADIVGNSATSTPVTFVVNNVSTGPTVGLVGYWSFDSAYVSGTTLFDQSGYSADATAFSTTFAPGQLGQGLHFDGSSSYTQVAASLPTQRYDLLNDLSLSLWVQTTNSTRTEALLSRYSAAGSGSGYLLRTTPAGTAELLLGIDNVGGGTTIATDITKINDGNWHHVAVVIRLGSTVTFYIDGVLSSVQSMNSMAAAADSYFQMGLNPWTPFGTYFTGTMDEVRVYNRALSANDVASLFLSVSVNPVFATLSPGLSQPFSAVVQNATNQSVTWSLSPNLGTISPTGLYTAPTTFTVSQTVTVTATTVVPPYGSGTASVNLVEPIFVSLAPASVTLYQGQTEPFAATVQNTSNLAVTWTISPNVGSISPAGIYTAPATVTTSQTVTVTATSVADPTKSASSTITLSPPVSVSVGPPSVTLYQGQTQIFTTTVLNTSNIAVTWAINPNVGTVGPDGTYTAPATVTTSQTVTVTATSVFDPTKSATSTVTLSPPVSVSVGPTSPTLYQGQMQTFAPTVLNTTNVAVTWAINPNVGSISPAGVYTAPPTVTSSQAITVTATSVFDPTKSGTATINLSPPISVSVGPASATLFQGQAQTFAATLQNTTNAAVTWAINPNVGSISSAGVYSAPGTVTTSQSITVTATSVADPTKSGTAIVTVTGVSTSSTNYITSKVPGALRNDYSGFVGMNILVGASPITVTALGRIAVAANSGTHTVKIVQASNGADISGASVSVNTGTGVPGTFVYGALASPVNLSANTSYYVVTQETSGGDQWYDFNSSVQTTSAATVTSAVYGNGPYVAVGSTGLSYGLVDFLYGPTAGPPSITQQPQGTTATVGQTATFSVTATGGNLTYQWESEAPGGSSFTAINGATASSYTTPATTLAQSGTQYMCVVTNTMGSANSTAATLTVGTSVSSTNYVTSVTPGTQRNDFTGWVGMSFTVGGSPVAVSALGRMFATGNSSSHIVKIVNGSNGQDVTGGSVSISMAGGTPGKFVYANLPASVTLSANTTYYLVSQELIAGDTWSNITSIQTSGVAAETTGVWSPNGAPYNFYGAANQAYVPVDFQYTVSIAQPAITQQPQSQTVGAGATATFNVAATGGNVTYQWESEAPGASSFTAIGGATASSYTTPVTTLAQSGTQYMCVVSNTAGSATSSAATLTVTASVPSTNYVTSFTLGKQRNDFTGWVGMSLTVGGSPVAVSALGRMFATGNSSSHIVKIVNGSNGQDVTGGSVSISMAGGTPGKFVYASLPANVTLSANTTYYIVSQEAVAGDTWSDITSIQTSSVAVETTGVWSPNGSTYNFYGAANQSYVPVDFQYTVSISQPVITQQPQSQTVGAGATATFNVAATGGNVTYQWESEAPGGSSFTAINGATAGSYTTAMTTLAQNGTQYMCVVSNTTGSATSSAATLTVVASAPSTNYVTSVTPGTQRNDFTGWVGMSFTVGGSPVAVSALGRMFATGNSSSHIVKIVNGSNGQDVTGGSVSISMAGGTPGKFVYANLPANVTLSANTTYYIVSHEVIASDTWSNITSIQTTGIAAETTGVWSPNGAPYNFYGAANQAYVPVDFQYTANPTQPVISQQPQGATVTAGQTATFSVAASGTGLTYQWQVEVPGGSGFTNITGAVGSSYTTGATQLSDSGTQFLCIVSNSNGNVTSNAATLTVAPILTGTAFVISDSLGTIRNNFTGLVGMTVNVGANPLTVTALGRLFVSGNSGSHSIKIVNAATGADLPGGFVSVNMSGGTANAFAYGTLASPVTLAANNTYYIVSQETFGGDLWYDYNSSVVTTAVASVTSAVYSSGSSYATVGSTGQTYGLVDFRYQ